MGRWRIIAGIMVAVAIMGTGLFVLRSAMPLPSSSIRETAETARFDSPRPPEPVTLVSPVSESRPSYETSPSVPRRRQVEYVIINAHTAPERLYPLFSMDTSYLSRVRRLEQLAGSLTDQESRALLQLIHYDAKRLNLAEPESNALQIAASLGDTSAVHTARQLLARDGDIQLRMSALAVLGLQGDVSDRDILRRYEQSSDIRLRNAAVAAAKKIYRKTDNTKEESS